MHATHQACSWRGCRLNKLILQPAQGSMPPIRAAARSRAPNCTERDLAGPSSRPVQALVSRRCCSRISCSGLPCSDEQDPRTPSSGSSSSSASSVRVPEHSSSGSASAMLAPTPVGQQQRRGSSPTSLKYMQLGHSRFGRGAPHLCFGQFPGWSVFYIRPDVLSDLGLNLQAPQGAAPQGGGDGGGGSGRGLPRFLLRPFGRDGSWSGGGGQGSPEGTYLLIAAVAAGCLAVAFAVAAAPSSSMLQPRAAAPSDECSQQSQCPVTSRSD